MPHAWSATRCATIHERDGVPLEDHGHEFNATFILGGQIQGEEPRLFHIYSAGNFIESSVDTPYFQIGESKYGKPIIDRVISRSSSLAQAAKCALISMDSTIRSNLSVGPPLDLAIDPPRRIEDRDAHQHRPGERVLQDDPYALGLCAARGLQRAAESELVGSAGR